MGPQTDYIRLVCECGRAIRCAVGYEGERLGSLRFFDAPGPRTPTANGSRAVRDAAPGSIPAC